MLERPSPNWDARACAIDLVILHYTGMVDAETALARLTDAAPVAGRYPGPWQEAAVPFDEPLGRVSAHYLVGEAGEVWRLVPEDMRAWHAGSGEWEGRSDLNDRSIGIEIVNGGHDYGLPDFPERQIRSILALVRDILGRRQLSPWAVVGHSDVAPLRKADPGERFPWRRLAQADLSVWPGETPLDLPPPRDISAVQAGLRSFGYAAPNSAMLDPETEACVRAFQRRFRPGRIDGVPDAETCALLGDLVLQKQARERGA